MKVKRYFKSIIKKIVERKSKVNINEDEFYENLFINHPSWNTKEPNNDERKRWEIIESFIKDEQRNKSDLKILDLGCGRGWLSNLLSQYGTVTGLEPVKKVVEYAKSIFPNINFISGTMDELFRLNKQNSFDIIVSSEVIEHIEDDDKLEFVKNINRLLKTNGECIISTPRAEIQKDWLKDRINTQPIEDWISEEELNLLFKNNNFYRESIRKIALKAKHSDNYFDVYQVCLFKKI